MIAAVTMSCFGVCTGERCFAECDDDGTRVGSSYIIIGKNGGKVRCGLELDSEEGDDRHGGAERKEAERRGGERRAASASAPEAEAEAAEYCITVV